MRPYSKNFILFSFFNLFGVFIPLVVILGAFTPGFDIMILGRMIQKAVFYIFRSVESNLFMLKAPLYSFVFSLPVVAYIYWKLENHLLGGGKILSSVLYLLFSLVLLLGLVNFLYLATVLDEWGNGPLWKENGNLAVYPHADVSFFIFLSELVIAFSVGIRLIIQLGVRGKSSIGVAPR